MTALAAGLYDVPPGALATVVTYLERRTPAAESASALPEGVSVAIVPEPEPGWYRALFRRIGDPWLWFDRLRLADGELAALLHDRRCHVLVLRRDGEDVGLAEIDLRQSGAAEIVYFGLVPGATGVGLGRALMAAALAEAFRPGVERVWLHTCDLDDPRALGFYRRMGFAPYARKIEVTEDPRLTGLLPAEVAPQVPLLGG